MTQIKIFLDTNIVADMIDSSRNNHLLALDFLKKSIINDYKLYISEDMISTLYCISKDKISTLDFIKNIVLIDWEIVSFGKKIINNAIDISLKKNLDLEDILQCLCAKENNCKFLITNDKKFYDCGLEIRNLKEFLE
jgi:predicted nucleic acid-binding protein